MSTPLDALAASLGASDVVHEMLRRHADVPGCSVALIDDYRIADFAVGRARQSTGILPFRPCSVYVSVLCCLCLCIYLCMCLCM